MNHPLLAFAAVCCLLVGSRAQADWEVGNVELDLDTSWTSAAGSCKSQSLTSYTAEIVGNSATASGVNSPTSTNLERYTKVGSPPALTVTVSCHTKATADAASSNSDGFFSASTQADASTTWAGGHTSTAWANLSGGGVIDPAAVVDPGGGAYRVTQSAMQINATTTVTATLKVVNSATTGGAGTSSSTSGNAKAEFLPQ